MKNRISMLHRFITVIICLFCTGCWLFYSWEDYLPLATVNIYHTQDGYTSCFTPRYHGKHMVALRIQDRSSSSTPVHLVANGWVKIKYPDGSENEITFDRYFDKDYCLPPSPGDLSILNFNVKNKCAAKECLVSFYVKTSGNVSELLNIDPNCSIIWRFNDCKE